MLGQSMWVVAQRTTRKGTKKLGATPVHLGCWDFKAARPRVFAFANPKPELTGSWPALNGKARLQVDIEPTYNNTLREEGWEIRIELSPDSSVYLAFVELRSVSEARGAKREQLSPGGEVKFQVRPPHEQPLWVWVEGSFGGKDRRREEDFVELPLLAGGGGPGAMNLAGVTLGVPVWVANIRSARLPRRRTECPFRMPRKIL